MKVPGMRPALPGVGVPSVGVPSVSVPSVSLPGMSLTGMPRPSLPTMRMPKFGLPNILKTLKLPKLPNLPKFSWSVNDEKYGVEIPPSTKPSTGPYEGSYFAAIVVATQTFLSEHYISVILCLVLFIAGVVLVSGLFLNAKHYEDEKKAVDARKWGIYQTVENGITAERKQAKKPITYQTVPPHDLKKVQLIEIK